MTTELWVLVWMGVLQFFVMMLHGTQIALTNGIAWGIGRRDTAMPVTDLGRRIDRTLQNGLESLSVYGPLAVALHAAGLSGGATAMAAQVYLAARLAFALVYLSGVPVIRTVLWFIGNAAMVVMAWPLLSAAFGQ